MVLAHAQRCTERQLCVAVMCSRYPAVASALALGIEGNGCGYVMLLCALWHRWVFITACFTINRNASALLLCQLSEI